MFLSRTKCRVTSLTWNVVWITIPPLRPAYADTRDKRANFFAHSKTKFPCQLLQPGISTVCVFLLPVRENATERESINACLTFVQHKRSFIFCLVNKGFFHSIFLSVLLANSFFLLARVHVFLLKLHAINSYNLTDCEFYCFFKNKSCDLLHIICTIQKIFFFN